jgi:hypothetical protein
MRYQGLYSGTGNLNQHRYIHGQLSKNWLYQYSMNFIKKLKSLLLFSSLLLNPLVMAQSNTLKTENLLMN